MSIFLCESSDKYHIGVCLDANTHMCAFTEHSPVPVTLTATMGGSRKLAGEIRQRFAHLKSHGYWFMKDPAILEYFQSGGPTDAPTVRGDMDEFFRYNVRFGPGLKCPQKGFALKYAERCGLGEVPAVSQYILKKEILLRGGREGLTVEGMKAVKVWEGLEVLYWDHEERLARLRADGREDVRPPRPVRTE